MVNFTTEKSVKRRYEEIRIRPPNLKPRNNLIKFLVSFMNSIRVDSSIVGVRRINRINKILGNFWVRILSLFLRVDI